MQDNVAQLEIDAAQILRWSSEQIARSSPEQIKMALRNRQELLCSHEPLTNQKEPIFTINMPPKVVLPSKPAETNIVSRIQALYARYVAKKEFQAKYESQLEDKDRSLLQGAIYEDEKNLQALQQDVSIHLSRLTQLEIQKRDLLKLLYPTDHQQPIPKGVLELQQELQQIVKSAEEMKQLLQGWTTR